MTGESLPVDKGMGDEVFCGTINRFGSIDITATKVGEDSSLQKLIRMVQDAENKQAPMQRIADNAPAGWCRWPCSSPYWPMCSREISSPP